MEVGSGRVQGCVGGGGVVGVTVMSAAGCDVRVAAAAVVAVRVCAEKDS